MSHPNSKGSTKDLVSNDSDLWKRIIDIKTQLLELQSPNLKVTNQSVQGKFVNFEIEDVSLSLIIKEIEQIFETKIKGNPNEYLSFHCDSIISERISDSILEQLKQKALDNFIDFEGYPVIEGSITTTATEQYQESINNNKLGIYDASKKEHSINISDLLKTTDVLLSLNQDLNNIIISSTNERLSNDSIKTIRKITNTYSHLVYSSQMSSSQIKIDISKSEIGKSKILLKEIYNAVNDKNDIILNLKLKTDFDQKPIVKAFSEKKIKSHWDEKKSKLFFWKKYKKGQLETEKRILDSWIHEKILSAKIKLEFENTDLEKYVLIADEKKKYLWNNGRLEGLKSIDFCFKDENRFIDFGTLIKIDYPIIRFKLADEFLTINELPQLREIQPSLKGEKDKIKRLKDTLDNFNRSKNELLKFIANPESCKNIYSEGDLADRVKEVNHDCLNNNLNEKQIEAISKSTLASSLFLIQGPPGTGKSTAISEIIWQHIIRDETNNYKILVTSETNLAVDNAINKLSNDYNMLIKPIRFGLESSVDEEGRRFLFSSLKNWKNQSSVDQTIENNILDKWIEQIINRSKKQKNEFTNLWIDYLNQHNNEVRKVFFETYLKYCNVIGATSGSIGEKSSINKDTPFNKEYKEVSQFDNIQFDLVVQDESSKSTFPELLIPCIYSKKAIIIGDHRQLPPMINTNEFIEEFEQVSKQVDATKQIQIKDSIKFIKKHSVEFDTSYFEKLFLKLDAYSKSSFNVQYRMHPSINNTISQFYAKDEGLFCGLSLDDVNDSNLQNKSSRYLGQKLFNGAKVVWIDTKSPEIKVGTSRVNFDEVNVIEKLITSLDNDEGYTKFKNHWKEKEENQIGIITFYVAQKQLLVKAISKEANTRISVVDRFQGMERNIIIVSLVRSNKIAESESSIESSFSDNNGENSLGFAQSPNRLNVALSRAKRLLIIVGNVEHFSQKEIYKNVYKSIKNDPNGLVIDYKEFLSNE